MLFTKILTGIKKKFFTHKEDIGISVIAIVSIPVFLFFAITSYQSGNSPAGLVFAICVIIDIGSSIAGRYMWRIMRDIQKQKNTLKLTVTVIWSSTAMVTYANSAMVMMVDKPLGFFHVVILTLAGVLIIYATAFSYVQLGKLIRTK